MTLSEIAQTIDHTLLKPNSTFEQIEQLCKEAMEHRFASVCVLPHFVHRAHDIIDDSGIKVCTVVGFPLGSTYGLVKAHEAKEAIARGADEIDMVLNIPALINGEFEDVLYDIEEVVEACHALNTPVKVIIETCLLTDDQKLTACDLVNRSMADFIKTSTGFSTGGATVHDIKLLRANVGKEVRVKASGGIRTREFAIELLEAGADRLGTSSGVAIIGGHSGSSLY
jgi:deoxyribose-phosphate aldolase